MDSLTRDSRLSYACAFGSTAYLVYSIVISQTFAIEYDGHRAVKCNFFMIWDTHKHAHAHTRQLGHLGGDVYGWIETYKLSIL